MESEKVKKIKEYLQEEVFIATKFEDKLRRIPTRDLQNLLTLINELESDNKSLQDLCNKTYEDLTKEIDRLENRVKELEEGIAKSMLGCEFLPECTNDKLKRFAERLKEKCEYNRKQYCCSATVGANDIDETLKEFIKD